MKVKKKIIFTYFIIMIITLMGCQTDVSKKEIVMVDREGNNISIPTQINRILSTAPSNTEILVGLGLGEKLVGIDMYSTDVEGIPSDIEVIDFANPDPEAIIAMQPDIIIGSETNKINNNDPYAVLKEAGISVVYIPSSNSIEGIYEDIKFISQVTNQELKGQEIIRKMQDEVNAIKNIASEIQEPKTVYFEIGSTPSLYSVGSDTFINDLIETVGAQNIFRDQVGWITVSEESIIHAQPDVILTNENYLENSIANIKERPGFQDIKAIQDNHLYLIDKNSSSRASQYIINALKEIANAIYPEYYEN